ncbi:hypothetical protein ATJ97_0177 [Georgenia soli]|uniref:Uncharacterized protein n=1 Tax=Georgenia soli TaxID=638953 RepID=A0A2A9F1M0_9MICO|nr:hypothetical protein [Georgenia soli]PFG44903.1 hypothetical protein ATJ97_0177 [Georgenia soli]
MPELATTTDEDLQHRWHAMVPFVSVGLVCIIVGGLVAAVTGPTGFEDGSWAAAYLVLVAGVAQLGLGVGQALVPARLPTPRTRAWEIVMWNAGNTAVLAATLAGTPVLVAAGGLVLIVALALFAHAVRGPRTGSAVLFVAHLLLVCVIAVSIPVGLVLSVLRHR